MILRIYAIFRPVLCRSLSIRGHILLLLALVGRKFKIDELLHNPSKCHFKYFTNINYKCLSTLYCSKLLSIDTILHLTWIGNWSSVTSFCFQLTLNFNLLFWQQQKLQIGILICKLKNQDSAINGPVKVRDKLKTLNNYLNVIASPKKRKYNDENMMYMLFEDCLKQSAFWCKILCTIHQ